MRIQKDYIFLFTFIFVTSFFIIDLGNLNAIRQGTEGFYLQISNEMFENLSFLTPTYMGDNHWSKPPLHFWLAQPFYAAFGNANIFSARLSIVLLSITCIFFISTWVFKHFKISKYITFIFICSSIGILKYSRIFMMEAPLSLISTLTALTFYDYLYSKKIKYLAWSSILLGLSILIKGPVSYVMITGGLFVYLVFIYTFYKENHSKNFIYLSTISLIIGTLWFIRSYIEYGQEFIQYFFIRENLGKFNSKHYPVRHVFQGLILYGLPWSIYLISYLNKPYFIYIKTLFDKNNKSSQKFFFILINFICYFALWLIPNQRSHHYAIPALPFFLILLLTITISLKDKFKQFGKITNKVLSLIYIIPISVLLLAFNFNEFTQEISSIITIIIGCIFGFTTIYIFWKNFAPKYLFFTSFCTISFFWIMVTPLFILPKLPSHIKTYLHGKEVAGFVHKPYFLEKALGRKFTFVSQNQMYKHITSHPNMSYFLHESVYTGLNLNKIANIEKRWQVWSRGRRMHHIMDAISNGNLASLKEEIFIIKAKR